MWCALLLILIVENLRNEADNFQKVSKRLENKQHRKKYKVSRLFLVHY